MCNSAVAEKNFQRKLAHGLNRTTCRKQEKGLCTFAHSFIRESMRGEQAKERGRGRQASVRWDEKKRRMKAGERLEFESLDPSTLPDHSIF